MLFLSGKNEGCRCAIVFDVHLVWEVSGTGANEIALSNFMTSAAKPRSDLHRGHGNPLWPIPFKEEELGEFQDEQSSEGDSGRDKTGPYVLLR